MQLRRGSAGAPPWGWRGKKARERAEDMKNALYKEIRPVLESRWFLGSVLALCAANAFCTGFYRPGRWAQNYYTLSFFDGFFRRALIGTVLYPFGEWRMNYHFISAIQMSVSVCLLFLAVRRMLAMERLNGYIYIYPYFFSRIGELSFLMWLDTTSMPYIFWRCCRSV